MVPLYLATCYWLAQGSNGTLTEAEQGLVDELKKALSSRGKLPTYVVVTRPLFDAIKEHNIPELFRVLKARFEQEFGDSVCA